MADTQQSEGSAVRMYGILFTVIAAVAAVALIYMFVLKSQADDTSQTAGVSNAVPTIDSILTSTSSGGADSGNDGSTGIAPNENNLKRVYLIGDATDNNGCNDIDTAGNWTFGIYRSGTPENQTVSCPADNNHCYVGTSPANITLSGCTGVGDLTIHYEGYVDFQFYADATDAGSAFAGASQNWTSYMKVEDEHVDVANSTLTDIWELGSLRALDVSASANYGTLALGADSAVQTINFTQVGNRSYDIYQKATSADVGNMVCDGPGSQNIGVGQVKTHLSNATFAWTDVAAVAFTNADAERELDMGRRSVDGSALSKAYYLRLRMPATGLRGTCTNTATFTAVVEEAA